ncbi:MAG: biotin/lipoyl-binding protein [Oscillospiraceae bacterium]|nr:biotin/lipoyl-binding protein [Oscillospiraceae bacterium]
MASMKRYSITVNGSVYDVTVEESDSVSDSAVLETRQISKSHTTVSKSPTVSSGKQGDIKIQSPMPGNIVDIKFNEGDRLEKGAVIAVLEAMKMENDIVAPSSGVIASINVRKGESVNTGTLIATMDK